MASDLLSEFGVSDGDVAAIIETAGAVITRHGFMFVGDGPDIDVFDIHGELRAIHFTYHLPVNADTALDLYMEFIQNMLSKEQRFPSGFHIAFGGALQ